jgi:hypothetical protein
VSLLKQYPCGTCCGSTILDGFFDRQTYPHQTHYPTRAEMLKTLDDLLRGCRNNKGQVIVVLNQDQGPSWKDDLESRGFILLYSDVANPNHSGNENSRLYTFMRVNRYFQGDRDEADLGDMPTVVPIPDPPPPPPPPPAPTIQRVSVINYGRPI